MRSAPRLHRYRLIGAVLVAALCSGIIADSQSQPKTDDALTSAVRQYAAAFAAQMKSLVMEEHYKQTLLARRGGGPRSRKTTSEVVMIRAADEGDWVLFRDVLVVDGRRVANREGRLMALLTSSAPDALAQASRIANESSRYNLGQLTRSINAPDVAIAFLRPEHASRIRVERGGRERVQGAEMTVLKFNEIASPTLIRGVQSRDMFSSGRLWVEPAHGRIWRTELRVGDQRSAGTLMVDFGPIPGSDVLVPLKMTERHTTSTEELTATAIYQNVRRFEVATNTEFPKKLPGHIRR